MTDAQVIEKATALMGSFMVDFKDMMVVDDTIVYKTSGFPDETFKKELIELRIKLTKILAEATTRKYLKDRGSPTREATTDPNISFDEYAAKKATYDSERADNVGHANRMLMGSRSFLAGEYKDYDTKINSIIDAANKDDLNTRAKAVKTKIEKEIADLNKYVTANNNAVAVPAKVDWTTDADWTVIKIKVDGAAQHSLGVMKAMDQKNKIAKFDVAGKATAFKTKSQNSEAIAAMDALKDLVDVRLKKLEAQIANAGTTEAEVDAEIDLQASFDEAKNTFAAAPSVPAILGTFAGDGTNDTLNKPTGEDKKLKKQKKQKRKKPKRKEQKRKQQKTQKKKGKRKQKVKMLKRILVGLLQLERTLRLQLPCLEQFWLYFKPILSS